MSSQNLQQQVGTWPQLRIALIAGTIAGPLYVGIGTLEAVLRDGFDIRIHSLSLLANGAGGWIHSTMMVVSGLLTIIGALGVKCRSAARRTTLVRHDHWPGDLRTRRCHGRPAPRRSS